MSLTEWLLSVPCRLTFACFLFILYCNVFRRRSGALPQNSNAVRQSQPFQNSRIEHRLLNPPVYAWIEALSRLRHYLRFLVESWSARTKLRTRGTSLSLSPRPLLAVILSPCLSCDRTGELSLYAAIHTIFMFCWGWLPLELLFGRKCLYIYTLLITIERTQHLLVSYFCLIARHTLFKTLDTPMFCFVEIS